jgi:hypothetical protein
MLKSGKVGVLQYGLQLAPHKLSGYQVCPKASKGCSESCLFSSGMGAYKNVREGRIRKTKMYFENRGEFMSLLREDIETAIRKAKRENVTLAIRLNTISDISWENTGIIQAYPEVQFFDYTKIKKRMFKEMPANYHLTFSRSESNQNEVEEVVNAGKNVAVVFSTKKKGQLPSEWLGKKVIDGDEHDARFIDEKNVIVGLRAKGKARKDNSGFVVHV